jgi:tRNA-Thr(GGU) m(6)t(6)A37 methyltransferase TsaA
MTTEYPPMTLKAIGIVHSKVKETPAEHDWWADLVSEIVIDASLTEALEGLEEYSHIIVIYWMHKVSSQEVPLKVRPMGRKELPLRGLFASRAPHRPNRIGKTTVQLLKRQDNILSVKGLDALDGTPVLDIKPYIPGYDSADNVRVPRG